MWQKALPRARYTSSTAPPLSRRPVVAYKCIFSQFPTADLIENMEGHEVHPVLTTRLAVVFGVIRLLVLVHF